MVESGRKHGPFDRSPGRPKIATPSWNRLAQLPGPFLPEPTAARFRGARRIRGLSECARPSGVPALRRSGCEERRRAGACDLGVGGRQR
jgi:hypothetical protein